MRLTRSPGPAPASERRRRDDHLRRWWLRALVGLVLLLAAVATVAVILLRSLDQPWLKRRVQRLVRNAAGVEIDYREARVELLSGVEIQGLVVRSPTEVRAFAPDLLSVSRLDARWSLRSLALGGGSAVPRVTASDVVLAVVVDEHGKTSFDALAQASGSGRKSETPRMVPLSRQPAKLLGEALPVGQVEVDGLTLALIRTDHGRTVDRAELHGVSVGLAASSAEPDAKGSRVKATLGSPSAPLELAFVGALGGAPEGVARARFWFTADATSSALKAAVDLRMIEQTFASSVAADHWLHAEANLHFYPTEGRTEIRLERAEAGDGAATAEASMEISDAGSWTVRRAEGSIDLARILRWLPAGVFPVTAERARVQYQVGSLSVGPVVRLSEDGAVAVDADFSDLTATTPSGQVRVGGAALSLRGLPAAGGGVAGRGSAALERVQFASGGDLVAADGVAFDFAGTRGADESVDGRAGLRFERLERRGAWRVQGLGGRAELAAHGVHFNPEEPLATRGDLSLTSELASLSLASSGANAMVDGLALRVHAALGERGPFAVELEAPISRLRVIGGQGDLLVDAPVRLECRVRDLYPDTSRPAATRGVLHGTVEVGAMQASVDATTKGDDAVDFDLSASARSLKDLRPLLPPAVADEARWDQISVAVRSTGRAEGLGHSPAVRQTTEVDIEHPEFGNVSARALSLTLASQGTVSRHHADLDLESRGLDVGVGSPSDDHVALSVTVERERPSLEFQLATQGRATGKLSGALSFDASRRAVPYDIQGHIAGLAPLAPLAAKVRALAAFDLSDLEVGLTARGALLGVVAGFSRDGHVALYPEPERTAAVEGEMGLQLAHFRWAKDDIAVVTPAFAWHGDMHVDGARRTVESRLDVGTLHLDLGNQDVDLNGVHGETSATATGSLSNPEIELGQRLSIGAVEQTLVPEYPLGDLALSLSAERGPEGVVHVSDLKVSNGLGGTALALTGNVDLGEGRRTLSTTATLTQELARLSNVPERFRGQGRTTVEANVTSPDLAHFQVRAAVKGENVTFKLARAGVDVEAANGEIPVTVALEAGEHGVALRRSESRSPYSMLRFADQHPLLSRSGFLSIARLKTPLLTIAPLVGNLEVEQNVVLLQQFEMGVRGGSITGQCGIDWDGSKSTLELHVRASGVQSSRGEPFDGNFAVVVSAADRTVDGRAEILRIGKRHLLDLLDVQDPLHVDPAMNRVRTALTFGYPDSLRLIFDHGFASAHLELGGLARIVSISELRGIPMGPIVDKMLAPMLDAPYANGTP